MKNNLIVVDDDTTLSPRQFHDKFKSKDDNQIELDLFAESSDEEIPEEKSLESVNKPTYRPIVSIRDVIKQPPKNHEELVSCFRERLHLQSHLKYTTVEEQKELADVLMMAIVALWPQHRKQAANPFLSEAGNKELQRRVAIHLIETVEKLFYDYVVKAEEWNSKLVFSSQANLSRLKTQILHEANRSLNVLTIRRQLAEQMHNEGIWLKDPSKGYIKTMLNALDKWQAVTTECKSHDEYVRRQLRELKAMMPNLSEHHMRGQLDDLIYHVEQVMTDRQNRAESSIQEVQCEESRLSREKSLKDVIKSIEETLEDVDEELNLRVIYKRCGSMPNLHDELDLHEGFEDFKAETLKTKRLSVNQILINGVIKQKQINKSELTPSEDLMRLATRNNECDRKTSSDDDFSPLLQAQQDHKKSLRQKEYEKRQLSAITRSRKATIDSENDETSEEKSNAREQYQPPSLNIKIPGKNIVRICDVRVSNRTNASALTLDMHPTIYNEFLDEVDEETVKSLDHHLYAGAEIQEVYDEITKTYTKDFLDFDKDSYVEACPDTCRNISQLFMSGLLQDPKNVRYVNTDLKSAEEAPWREFPDANEWRNEPKFAGIGREDMLKISNKAELRRSTFVNDQTSLGGVGQLAKNYASWLTWYRNNVNLDDFKKFISNKETDYLCQMHHLYDSDDGEEELAEAARTSAHLQKLREREELRQKLLQEKSKYEKGYWNAQCINLGGLGKDPKITLHDESLKENGASTKEIDKQPSFIYLQDRLEQIWKALKMPDAQRLDMAIKHSSDPSLDKLTQVVDYWGRVSELIAHREAFMARLESFERSASDPNRFFEKGPNGSSIVRLNESKVREKLSKEIRALDLEIAPLLNQIKKKYNDDVTYQGRNYALKMQTDRTEMLYWLQQERREERLDAHLHKNNKPLNLSALSIGDKLSEPVK